jgi:hypothetical protein
LRSAIATLLAAGIVMSFYLIVSGFYFFVEVGKVIFKELFKEELQEPKEKSGKMGR